MTDYQILVEKIAKAIAVVKYPYDGNGDIIVRENVRMSVDEFWNEQTKTYKNDRMIEAQAALDVMSNIGMQEVIYQSLKSYLNEK